VFDLRWTDLGFDYRSGRYNVATAWMGDCEQVNHQGT